MKHTKKSYNGNIILLSLMMFISAVKPKISYGGALFSLGLEAVSDAELAYEA
jgi:hypothetical protein